MLGKVMKYELRASGRLLLPLFGLAIIVCALLRLAIWGIPAIWESAGNIVTPMATLFGIVLIIVVAVLAFVAVVVRFYQGMVSNEAYLSFTLPVKPSTHVLGRLLTGSLYSFAGILVATVGLFILVPQLSVLFNPDLMIPTNMNGTQFMLRLGDIPSDILLSFIGVLLVSLVLGVVTNLLFLYVSMAIGTAISPRNRILGSVAAYLILNTVESILTIPFAILPMMLTMGTTNEAVASYMAGLASSSDVFESMRAIFGTLWFILGISLLVSLVFAVVHYFLTTYFFSKKLNLE